MARPKGTLKFRTPDDLIEGIERYFKECESEKEMPTKGGLALSLNISKESLGDYIKRDNYSDSLKRAYNLIENAWVQRLTGQSVAGVIFYLKNAFSKDWRDKQETDITTGGKPLFLPSEIINKYNLNGTDAKPETDSQ